MDEDCKENPQDDSVVYGHKVCQTREAKWLCVENLQQKFHRPNFYDIGGTYIQDVADYWFLYKTERVGDIFLLHLFVCNHQEGAFNVAVSYNSELKFDKKNKIVYLSQSVKECRFDKMKENSQNYLTTYSLTDLDVDSLKDYKLYIAVSFHVMEQNIIIHKHVLDVKASHDFGALQEDPIGSDFTIESADGEQFRVHKVLLAAHSEVFKAMLKEDTAESQNNYVKLIDVGKEDLRCILEFIYRGTVLDLENCNYFNLLMLADKYNLDGLKELSEYALCQQLTIENAPEVLVVGDMYNSGVLKNAALKFIKKNSIVLQTSTFKELNNPELIRELCQYLVPS